ncbi:hypothetical protein AM500_00300 [Bacillus sp. FJAT-18017]|nr:hypothetical protein AM500_00300 [Bacillus sp. FJAT-18017]
MANVRFIVQDILTFEMLPLFTGDFKLFYKLDLFFLTAINRKYSFATSFSYMQSFKNTVNSGN